MSEKSGVVSVIRMAILRNVTTRKYVVNVRTVLLLLIVKILKIIKCFFTDSTPTNWNDKSCYCNGYLDKK